MNLSDHFPTGGGDFSHPDVVYKRVKYHTVTQSDQHQISVFLQYQGYIHVANKGGYQNYKQVMIKQDGFNDNIIHSRHQFHSQQEMKWGNYLLFLTRTAIQCTVIPAFFVFTILWHKRILKRKNQHSWCLRGFCAGVRCPGVTTNLSFSFFPQYRVALSSFKYQ